MRAFVMTPERLKHEGYKLENLGKDEILGFRRCRDCHGLFSFLDWMSGEWRVELMPSRSDTDEKVGEEG